MYILKSVDIKGPMGYNYITCVFAAFSDKGILISAGGRFEP